MAVNWTKEQEQVINLRNRNILVSAALVPERLRCLCSEF